MNEQLSLNKEIVTRFWDLLFNKHDLSAAGDLITDDYIQHNPKVATSRQGFNKHFSRVFKEVPERSSTIKRVIAEGEYVVLHSHTRKSLVDRGKAHMDIFRIENGKIAEHWDVIQEIPEESANKNTMF